MKPGGVLFLSTDYWPDKIDTSGLTMFGVPWSIFSSHQATQFVEKAKLFGLRLDGPLILLAKNPVIDFLGRRYTFLALEFQKIA